MLGVNHTALGALIAVTVRQPALVAPLALISHFALDVVPHFGNYRPMERGTSAYYQRIAVDAALSVGLLLLCVRLFPDLAGVVALGVFFSLLPDLLWPLALVVPRRGPAWSFFVFHKNIQTELPAGIASEVGFFAAMSTLLLRLSR